MSSLRLLNAGTAAYYTKVVAWVLFLILISEIWAGYTPKTISSLASIIFFIICFCICEVLRRFYPAAYDQLKSFAGPGNAFLGTWLSMMIFTAIVSLPSAFATTNFVTVITWLIVVLIGALGNLVITGWLATSIEVIFGAPSDAAVADAKSAKSADAEDGLPALPNCTPSSNGVDIELTPCGAGDQLQGEAVPERVESSKSHRSRSRGMSGARPGRCAATSARGGLDRDPAGPKLPRLPTTTQCRRMPTCRSRKVSFGVSEVGRSRKVSFGINEAAKSTKSAIDNFVDALQTEDSWTKSSKKVVGAHESFVELLPGSSNLSKSLKETPYRARQIIELMEEEGASEGNDSSLTHEVSSMSTAVSQGAFFAFPPWFCPFPLCPPAPAYSWPRSCKWSLLATWRSTRSLHAFASPLPHSVLAHWIPVHLHLQCRPPQGHLRCPLLMRWAYMYNARDRLSRSLLSIACADVRFLPLSSSGAGVLDDCLHFVSRCRIIPLRRKRKRARERGRGGML